MRIGAVDTPHLALWSWKQGFRIQMDWNNASCLTFSAVDILSDWDKSLLELDSLALCWPAVWQSLFCFLSPFLVFFFLAFLFICALAGQYYWAVLLFHLTGPTLVHTEEWEKVRGKVGKRVGQKSNLVESWTEVEHTAITMGKRIFAKKGQSE